MQRQDAERLDADDPLRTFRTRFVGSPGPIYLDGNSLGRPSRDVIEATSRAGQEWADDLVGGWDRWIDLPYEVGDRLGRLIGASSGQVVVCDSTTVNLYKLAWAAVAARPGRDTIVGLGADFPTDRYVLQGLSAERGLRLNLVSGEAELESAITAKTALVCVSHVNFVTGARVDARRLTELAHERGALVLLDLAHSVGALPVELDKWGTDLAVGCTYKYLNAGPGSPGFLYVNKSSQPDLRQPIWGWFGQKDQFSMGEAYQPVPGPGSYLTGTPGVTALRAVEAAIGLIEEAGVDRLWSKSVELTRLLLDRVQARLVPLGATVVTPADPERRGAHIAVCHPDAWPWIRALIERGLVTGDFRPPDAVRLGPAPLYSGFVECFDAVEAMAAVLEAGFAGYEPDRRRVT